MLVSANSLQGSCARFWGLDAGNAIMEVNDVRTTSGELWRIGSEMAAAHSPSVPPKWSEHRGSLLEYQA